MELTPETLGLVANGQLGAALRFALQKAYFDLADRPDLKKARKVTVVLSLLPVARRVNPALASELDAVDVDYDVQFKSPPQANRETQRLVVGEKGAMLFNDQTSDARQGTLDQVAPPPKD